MGYCWWKSILPHRNGNLYEFEFETITAILENLSESSEFIFQKWTPYYYGREGTKILALNMFRTMFDFHRHCGHPQVKRLIHFSHKCIFFISNTRFLTRRYSDFLASNFIFFPGLLVVSFLILLFCKYVNMYISW